MGWKIAKYSTRSLAEVTYTSPPTVLRLCKKLGFTGFDDFKQNFVRELEYLDQQQGKVDFNFPFAENDSPMRVAQNIGELYEEAVKDTMQLLRYEDLHKAVLLLKYHEEIHIFSAGTAINQAESFREKMLKIGKRVVIFNNLNYQRYQACCLSERDLAMIISYSGETAQMLEIARQCKRSGTPILALTSFGENSLTCYADCKLTLSTQRKHLSESWGLCFPSVHDPSTGHLVFRVLPAELPEELYLQAGTRPRAGTATHLHQSYFVEY